MKLINSSYEILEQNSGLEGIYEAIERAGRTCYKSERPEGKTAKDFVDMLIKRGHLSPLEHGTVYLKVQTPFSSSSNTNFTDQIFYGHTTFTDVIRKYQLNSYSKVNFDEDESVSAYITTNMRVLYENDWLDDLKYLCEPTEYHEKRVGVKVNCSIGISREWNRHRTLSICEQSTRYCNYSLDKFGNELTFVIPSWCTTAVAIEASGPMEGFALSTDKSSLKEEEAVFYLQLRRSEYSYLKLLDKGYKPQHAREVLPLATATEVVYTGFTSDWENFFQMRCDNAAHPDIRALAMPLKEEFIKRGFINENRE